jgi:diguanylate cyclase (GGDEF)-like protein
MVQQRPERHRSAPRSLPEAVSRTLRRSTAGHDDRTTAQLAAEIEDLRAALVEAQARAIALEEAAHEDPLTGLLNRRGFAAAFGRTAAYLQRYGGTAALLYLDLDRFKPVNDRHGHAAGDEVLRAAAARIRVSVRASDIVARLGGDEFAVLLWNLDAVNAEAKGLALEARIAAEAVSVAGAAVAVGASAGFTMLTAGDSLDAAMARADAAMYARKKLRSGRAFI